MSLAETLDLGPAAPAIHKPADEVPALRVLHVLRAPLGGLFRHVIDLAEAQIERGHAVGLVTDSLTGGREADAALAAIAPRLALGVLRLPMRREPHPSDLATCLRVARHVRRLAPDIVHGHGSKGGLFARATGFLPGSRRFSRAYTPHGGSFNQAPGTRAHRLYMAVERLLARRTDVLLFESAFIGSRFDALAGPCAAVRRVVPNGIAACEFVPVDPAPDAAELLYVGEWRFAKGIDTLITAVRRVNDARPAPVRLNLVGSGPDEAGLRAQAAANGLADTITFVGRLPARHAFALGRLLVVPSRAESLPYIVLEAAGARLPMIATNVGGIPEIFGPYADRLIDPDDPRTLADRILAMLDAPQAAVAADAARLADYVQGRFSFEQMVTAVVEGYRDALLRKRGHKAKASIIA